MRRLPIPHPTSRRSWLVAIAATMAALAPCSWSRVAAHDLGVTHAVLTFTPDRRYQLDVVVDPESILAKLEIYADRTPSAGVPADIAFTSSARRPWLSPLRI